MGLVYVLLFSGRVSRALLYKNEVLLFTDSWLPAAAGGEHCCAEVCPPL